MMRVKICGVRSVAEMQELVRAGVDAIGILVGPHTDAQRHFVSALIARDILQALPPLTTGVVVTTHTDTAAIRELLRETGATTIQIHSTLPLSEFASLRIMFPYVKLLAVVPVIDESSVITAQKATEFADGLVLDSAKVGTRGGAGVVHNWDLSARIALSSPIPVILAGGLTPENIQGAIAAVRPFGVDTRSGVCTESGEKDADKCRSFIKQAHAL